MEFFEYILEEIVNTIPLLPAVIAHFMTLIIIPIVGSIGLLMGYNFEELIPIADRVIEVIMMPAIKFLEILGII